MIRKESSAWLLLAEKVDVANDGLPASRHFLCWAILGDEAGDAFGRVRDLFHLVAPSTRAQMFKRIQTDLGPDAKDTPAYAPEWDKPNWKFEENQARVLACLMFAHEAASEGR